MSGKVIAPILSILILFAFATPCLAGGFDDVPADHWAYKAVQYLQSKGVLKGDEWSHFNGDEVLSRYEFATAALRIMDILEDSDGSMEIDGKLEDITDDIYAIVDELEAEFEAEIEEIYEILDDHEARIGDLEDSDEKQQETIEGLLGMHNIKFNADLRLRFEGVYNDDDSQVQRPRIRFRISMKAPVNNEITFKGRLASGDNDNPVSTNQEFNGEFVQRNFWIDQAYFVWEPESAPEWDFFAGKFQSNWKNTPATYDSDVNVEGIGQSFKSEDGFLINLAELVPDEKGFYIVAQVGQEDLFTDGLNLYGTYHWVNEEAWQFIAAKLAAGELINHMDLSRIDADDYQAIDIIGTYTWDASGTPVTLLGNYIVNLADDATPGESGLQQAAWAKVRINQISAPGDVEGWLEFGRLQANSVLSFITDADRGSGDQEYWVGGLTYQWMENFIIQLVYYHRERISSGASNNKVQVNFIGKV